MTCGKEGMETDYRKLLENLRDIVFTTDPAGRLMYVNRAVEAVLGFAPAQIVGRSVLDCIHETDVERARQQLTDCSKGGPADAEYRLLTGEGDVRWVRSACTPLHDGGTLIGFQGIWTDITERQLAERLQQTEKMEALGVMAGGIAHDLNNALGILVGYAELMLMDVPEESPLRDHARNIMEGGERAAAVVQDLLTLTRQRMPTKGVINLNRIVKDYLVSDDFVNLSRTHDRVEVRIQMDERLMNMSGSAAHLAKILANMAWYGAGAMPDGGMLLIRTENRALDRPVRGYEEVGEGEYVVLTVADTGRVIPPRDVKHIFEPFYARKVPGRGGAGLGLAVVWGMVKDQDGCINVTSEPGKGTAFDLYFTARCEEAAETSASAVSAYEGRGESVLIVDDDEKQRELAVQILSRLNYRVASAASGEEAVNYLKGNRADIVVLDMIMDPGMDGLDTYKEILKTHPHQRAVIVSGFAEAERVREAWFQGAGACISKPYVADRLARVVRHELDRPS
jgi:two-component system cell cycle sensor histidine kinase/response regulator CckA